MNLKSVITLHNQTNYNVHLRKKTLNESMKLFSDPLFVGFSGITFSYIAMADIFGCPVGKAQFLIQKSSYFYQSFFNFIT